MAVNFPPDIEYVTIPQLCERWGLTPSKIRRLIEERYLAAVRVDGVLSIPADFARGDEPLNSLRGTLLALGDAGFSDDEAIAWLFAENEELDGTPVASLLNGRKSAVRRATQSLAF